MKPLRSRLLSGLARRLIAFSFLALSASTAQAQCLRWDVNGAWVLNQSNGPTTKIELQQSGDQIRGSAGYRQYGDKGWFYDYKASIDGNISGDKMQLTVYWDQGAIGIYNARINPDGSVEGGTYDKRDPNTYATWTTDRKVNCSQHTPGIGADGRPALALGRVKLAPVANQCPRWIVGSVTKLTQVGTAVWMDLKLTQSGFDFSGEAKYVPHRGIMKAFVRGQVSGSVSGNEVKFTARWEDNTTGVYYGTIDANGRVTGYTYEQENHGISADWSMIDRATCDTNYHAERTGLQLGRVAPRDPSAPIPSICDAARSARARNSPAAPGLEARCRAVGETTNFPVNPRVDRSELDRLAEIGHTLARFDYSVGNLRRSSPDPQYGFGFDVASALFGDPALGAQGNTAVGPGSLNIRASLQPGEQGGFDDSKNFHFSRHYVP